MSDVYWKAFKFNHDDGCIVTLWIYIVTSSVTFFFFQMCHHNHNLFLSHDLHSDFETSAASVLRVQPCKLWFRCQVNTMDKSHDFIYRAGLALDLFACSILACAELSHARNMHIYLWFLLGGLAHMAKKQTWWVTKTWSFCFFYLSLSEMTLLVAISHVFSI